MIQVRMRRNQQPGGNTPGTRTRGAMRATLEQNGGRARGLGGAVGRQAGAADADDGRINLNRFDDCLDGSIRNTGGAVRSRRITDGRVESCCSRCNYCMSRRSSR